MIQKKINQWGNGQGLRIDKKIMDILHLSIGDKVECKVEKDKLIITPIRNKKVLTEEYLLSQLDNESFNELTETFLPEELEF